MVLFLHPGWETSCDLLNLLKEYIASYWELGLQSPMMPSCHGWLLSLAGTVQYLIYLASLHLHLNAWPPSFLKLCLVLGSLEMQSCPCPLYEVFFPLPVGHVVLQQSFASNSAKSQWHSWTSMNFSELSVLSSFCLLATLLSLVQVLWCCQIYCLSLFVISCFELLGISSTVCFPPTPPAFFTPYNL